MRRLHLTLLTMLLAGMARGAEPTAPLRLTHRQALQLGASNLLQARIAREIREQIRQFPEAERGAFDWQLSASASNGKLEFGEYNPRFSGLANLYLTSLNTTEEARTANLGLSKLDAIGGTINLSLNSGYNAFYNQVNSQTLPFGPMAALAFGTTNPYSGNLSLTYTQPLLRGFGREVTEARLQAALEQAKGADESFRGRMMELLTLVDTLYWNQVYARQNLANKTIALELAKKHLQEDKDRIEAGMLAPIELPQVQAAVAEWEKEVLAAKALLMNSQAALLENLFPDEADRPAALDPVDPPEAGPAPVPLAEAKALAFSRRPELEQAKHSLAANRTLEKAASNATLPQLDTQVSVIRDTSTYTDVNGVWNDWTQSRYPGYYVGLSFSYPIGNRARLARLAQARAATRGSEYVMKDTKTTVGLDVEQAYTDLTTARKQVEAADAALAFRQESLDAEMEKLANGLSTSFFVLQRQSELDQARTSDLEARIAAEKARTNLERAMGTLVDTAQ